MFFLFFTESTKAFYRSKLPPLSPPLHRSRPTETSECERPEEEEMRKKNKNQVPEMRWWCGNERQRRSASAVHLSLPPLFLQMKKRSENKCQKKREREREIGWGKRILDDIQAGPIITSFWLPPASPFLFHFAFSSCTTTTSSSSFLFLLRPTDSNKNKNNKPRQEGKEKRVSS